MKFLDLRGAQRIRNVFGVAVGAALVLALQWGCSTSSNLRKFEDGDLSKEISEETARKFEVREVVGMPSPSPSATPAAIVKKKKSKKGPAVPEPLVYPDRKPAQWPFLVGEKLEYGIRYMGVTAANLFLEVMPQKVVNNRPVFHFHAHAKTVALFELAYRVDDKINSYWDAEGGFSHRFTMDLDETKQSRKLIELYDYEKKKSYFWNRVDHAEKGLSEQKEQYDIPLWAQDPISALYFLRIADLPKTPGKEFRYPVIVDGKPWESVLKFLNQEKKYIDGKTFMANVYSLENYHNGEAKNRDNKVWISDDNKRYVLRVEAKVKVGSFAIALEDIK